MIKRNIIILLISLFAPVWHAFAQERVTGEIININHQYKIAFTDISSEYLKKGDLVEIYADGKFVSYLEVSDASGGISKLIPSTQPGKSKTADFSRIAVGHKVMKILPADDSAVLTPVIAPSRTAPAPSDHGLSEPEVKSLSENYAKLSDTITGVMKEKDSLQNEYHRSRQELEIALRKIKELDDQNASFAREIEQLRKEVDKRRADKGRERIKELQETIAALKSKLRHMAELMDKNIKAYDEQ